MKSMAWQATPTPVLDLLPSLLTTKTNRPQDTPIAGLYAAGACTGGLEGGGNAGYSGGLTKSSVFGMIAGESIARALGRPVA
jgi:fumarate reductase flavoprotein subunit